MSPPARNSTPSATRTARNKALTKAQRWARSGARGAAGDVGSYTANSVMSVNRRNRDSVMLKHGEDRVTMCSVEAKAIDKPVTGSDKPSHHSTAVIEDMCIVLRRHEA